MTEALERDLTTHEHIDNAHDAEFIETMDYFRRTPELPKTLTLTIDNKGLKKAIEEQIYKYYPQLKSEDFNNWTELNNPVIDAIIAQYNKENPNNPIPDRDNVPASISINYTKDIDTIIKNYIKKKYGWNNWQESISEQVPSTIKYTIEGWETLYSIAENIMFTYYDVSNLSAINKNKLQKDIANELKKQNNGTDVIKANTIFNINMTGITPIVNRYTNSWNNGHVTTPEQETPSQISQQFQSQSNTETQNQRNTEIVSENIPEKVTITIENNLGYTVKKQIYKYYANLTAEQKKDEVLLKKIMNDIKDQSQTQKYKIVSIDNVEAGKNVDVNMSRITTIIEEYLKDTEVKIERIHNQDYVVLEKYEDLKKNHKLLKAIWLDNTDAGKITKDRIKDILKKNEKVLIPNYLETEDTNPIKGGLDAITKPDKVIDQKLKDQTFILDPWHGFDDPWSLWLVKCNNIDNAHAIIYESWIVMDMSYRVAKLLRAHWATVKFTHYIPTRWISDKCDLPPCLPEQGKYQDVRNWSTWKLWVDGNGLANRCEQSNKYNWMFISLHADATAETKTENWKKIPKLLPERKKVSTKWRGEWKWKKFADYLMKNERWIPSQEWYTQTSDPQCLYVLGGENDNPGVLMELFNLNNNEQWNQYRNPATRQTKANEIVDAIVNCYEDKALDKK